MAAFSIYLINLDRSTDRLAAMHRQLLALGPYLSKILRH